jgi:hypothetical protein
LEWWTEAINTWITKCVHREEGTAPIQIGLDYRAIWDGTGKDARKKTIQTGAMGKESGSRGMQTRGKEDSDRHHLCLPEI